MRANILKILSWSITKRKKKIKEKKKIEFRFTKITIDITSLLQQYVKIKISFSMSLCTYFIIISSRILSSVFSIIVNSTLKVFLLCFSYLFSLYFATENFFAIEKVISLVISFCFQSTRKIQSAHLCLAFNFVDENNI